jgi:hypothetical protein
MSYLQTAYDNVNELKSVLKEAALSLDDAVITSEKDISIHPLTVIDIETYKELILEVTMHNASKTRATLIRPRPVAYILDASQGTLVDKLNVLGLTVNRLNAERKVEVESYTVSKYSRNLEKYEGMNLQTVKTTLQSEFITFPTGTYIVYMNQDNSNLAIEVLEPEAPNSFISFGVLETQQTNKLPIYRYLKTEKL